MVWDKTIPTNGLKALWSVDKMQTLLFQPLFTAMVASVKTPDLEFSIPSTRSKAWEKRSLLQALSARYAIGRTVFALILRVRY